MRVYSPIRHLAWSIWLNHDPARVYLGVFTELAGYYDASGSETDSDGAIVAIGLLSTEKKWLRFETHWRTALRIIKSPYLHMTHFDSNGDIYKHLAGRDDQKSKFMVEAIKAIKVNVNKVVIAVMPLPGFRAANALYKLDEAYAGPYTYVGGSCLAQAKKWLDKKHPRSPIRHLFEKGDTGQKEFLKVAEREGFNPIPQPKIDPQTGRWFEAFQAADLIAWQYRTRYLERIGKRSEKGPSAAFLAILKQLSNAPYVYDEPSLIRMCENDPAHYPKRT